MTSDRIFFPGNPWPEGHPVTEFCWTARIEGGKVWFDFALETADYDSERRTQASGETFGDWDAPSVWTNYGSCTISSDSGARGFPVCGVGDFSLARLDGAMFHLDPPPNESTEDEDFAFHVYLLGHDQVSDHRIAFTRLGDTDRFDIDWRGRIALAYAGDFEPRYEFHTTLTSVVAPRLLPE